MWNFELIFALFLPFLGAALVASLGRRVPRVVWPLGIAVPAVALLALLSLTRLPDQLPLVFSHPWIETFSMNLGFRVDGLSLFFGMVVTGIGVLIMTYARSYMRDYAGQPRLVATLLLFMGAMLGTVFSDDLLLLFMFWEMTSIASFLLIGFSHEDPASRRGARMALLVTGATALSMLAGIILLQLETGTLSLTELYARGGGGVSGLTLTLLLIGALGKSAQIPFHFWLPEAMAAPTPVSAYLHSATMVKLGVFLIARLYPIFFEHPVWWPLLTTVGFSTMALAAYFALRSADLKALLAWSTVSQLGFLVGFYGLGSTLGVRFDFVHILNHVLYKASLFMVVGIIQKSAGTRDLRELGGLFRASPVLGIIALIGLASMAGLPLTTGFISKEIMLADVFRAFASHETTVPLLAALIAVASIMKVAFAAKMFHGAFLKAAPSALSARWKAPKLGMLLPPSILAAATLVCGVFPSLLENPTDILSVAELHGPGGQRLALWHGFTRELATSFVILSVGGALFLVLQRRGWKTDGPPRWLALGDLTESAFKQVPRVGSWVTRLLRVDHARDHLYVVLATFLAAFSIVTAKEASELSAMLGGAPPLVVEPLRTFTAVVAALGALGVVFGRTWRSQVVSLSLSGFLTCFLFVLWQAPDLAITLVLTETVTLVLVLLFLRRTPESSPDFELRRKLGRPRNLLRLTLAIGMGALLTGLTALMLARPHPRPLGRFFLENTRALAEGNNAVNTILVDFRGFDTLGEIAVLVIALLGVLGLLMRRRAASASAEASPDSFPSPLPRAHS